MFGKQKKKKKREKQESIPKRDEDGTDVRGRAIRTRQRVSRPGVAGRRCRSGAR